VQNEPIGALTGYRVLDLADSRGAYCSKLLADLGADVIKIEPPEGDPGRSVPPFAGDVPHNEKSLYFLHRNANKRGLTTDLHTPEGKALLKKLVKTADVLVENASPDYMKNLGLDYSVLRDINPELVMASMTEFGPGGPYRDYRGSNLVDFAMSGVMITSGFPGKTPCLVPGSQSQDSASLIAAIGILAALYMRSTTGKGQHIETSVHEASRIGLYPWLLSTYTHLMNEAADGGVAPQAETRMGDSVYPVFPCKDGFIRLIALTPRQWDAMVRVLGNPEVLLLPEWRNLVYRIFNADAIHPIMTEHTSQYTMQELFEAGHREGVPVAPIFSVEDFVNSPHTRARGFFVEMDHPVVGAALYPGPPYRWSETVASIRRPAPCLGEHNQEILQEADIPQQQEDSSVLKQAGAGYGQKTGDLPLKGIKVIAFETGAAGPDFTKILGELGADIIKMESADNLDFARCIGSDINRIGGFNESNRNKRSFGINLKTPEGQEIARKLIKRVDILAENFRGGVMESLGLDYANVRKLNPDIIYISSQGFGGNGPYSDYQAYGPIVAAASGMLSIWANPDDPYPVGSNAPLPDHTASKHLAVAALAALDFRSRTGKGQYIDTAQTEVAAALLGEYYMDYTVNNRVPKPIGNRNPNAAPHGCYRCKGEDTWCVIAVFTDAEWSAFCRVLDHSLAQDRKFANLSDRLANVDDLDRLVEEWTSARNPHEVMEALQAVGVPAGVVQRVPDTIKDPQLEWLGAIIEMYHPKGGKTLYPAIPFRMSGTPPLESSPAPLLGQHTVEICREHLGLSEEEIVRLVNKDILQTPESTEGQAKGMFG